MHQRSLNNFTRYKTLLPQRGNIVDTNGRLLATNRPIITLFWQGAGSKKLSLEQKQIITLIEAMLKTEFDLQAIRQAQRSGTKHKLAHDLSTSQLYMIAERYPNHPNITLQTECERYYPYQSVACHVLGYLGQMQEGKSGKMGLEKMYDNYLTGKSGRRRTVINSSGKPLAAQDMQTAMIGKTLHTTLNIDLQRMLHRTFPRPYAGAAIIMNTHTGSLRAVHSFPTYQPQMFLRPISQEKWKKISKRNPFINRAFEACYPPASTFKLISCAAALEEDIVDPSYEFTCKGSLRFGKRRYYCNNRKGHGQNLHTLDGLIHSCNILFYEIGQKIKIDCLAKYSRRFGLGSPTGLNLPERAGLVPTKSWKKETKGERWWAGETLLSAIGQSFLLVTPIQIARMIASIQTGYLVTPRILENESIHRQALNISESTREFLNNAMEQVVEQGTAKSLSGIEGLSIQAKTGTAQTSHWAKRGMGKEYLEHIWCVANFCYKDQEPLTLVMLAENAGAARIVTDATRELLQEYCNHIDSTIASS